MIVSRLFSVIALTIFLGCASTRLTTAEHLRARLGAPPDVKLGDSAQLSLTVYNESPLEARLVLWAANGVAFDPIVRQGNDTVWQRSRSYRVMISGSRATRVPPGDSLTFAAVWRLTDNDGHSVSPGVYEVIAILRDDAG